MDNSVSKDSPGGTGDSQAPAHKALSWWRRPTVRLRYALVAAVIGVLSAVTSAGLLLNLPPVSALATDAISALQSVDNISGNIVAHMFALVAGALGLYLAYRTSRHPLVALLAAACASISACVGMVLCIRAVMATLESGVLIKANLHALLANKLFIFGILGSGLTAFAFGLVAFAAFTMFYLLFPQRVTLFDHHFSKELSEIKGIGTLGLSHEDRQALSWLRRQGVAGLTSKCFQLLLWPPVLLLTIFLLYGFAPTFYYDGLTGGAIATVPAVATACFLPFALMYGKRRHLGQADQAILNWILLGQTLTVFTFAIIAVVLLAWSAELRVGEGSAYRFFNAYLSIVAMQFMGIFHTISLIAIAFAIFSRGTLDPGLVVRRTWVIGLTALVVGLIFVFLERVAAGWLIRALGVSSDTALLVIGGLVAASFFPIRSWCEGRVKALFDRYLAPESFAHGDRQIAAIVFSDLTGYSALSARNESDALLTAALFQRSAKLHAPDFGGRVVKTIGDAVMMSFPDAQRAVDATRKIHADYAAKAAAVLANPLQPHAGIHVGEVIAGDDGDVYGGTVNIAARLQGHAQVGQIVLSEAVRAALASDAAVTALGPLALKNIPEPMTAYSAPA